MTFNKRVKMNNNLKEFKEVIKEEILELLKEETSNVEDMVFSILDAQSSGNTKKAEKYFGILFPRLASLGFDRNTLLKMKSQLTLINNEKEATKFITRWKLSDQDINKNNVYTYKMIVSVPFATNKNEEELVKKLKYDLVSNGHKILGYKKMPVSKIASAGAAGEVIDLKILVKIKTMAKPNEIESELQPDYGVDKIKGFDVEQSVKTKEIKSSDRFDKRSSKLNGKEDKQDDNRINPTKGFSKDHLSKARNK